MAEDLDYQSDVLKFKHVWADNKNPDHTRLDLKNLQTIDSNRKIKHKSSNNTKKATDQQLEKDPHAKTYNRHNVNKDANNINQDGRSLNKDAQNITKLPKPQGQRKKSASKVQKRKPDFQQKHTIRNPRHEATSVIEVSTKANKFYSSNLQNQKNNIATSHLYLDNNSGKPSYTSVYDFKKALQEKDYELSMLRVSNSRTEDRVRFLEKEVQKKDQTIRQLRERQRKVIEKNCSMQTKQFNFDYGKAQYQNFRNDSRRLLKMLQSTSEYKDFARFALDDDGVRFLNNANKDLKTKLDNAPNKNLQSIHFCTCNKAFIPESGFWVPDKVYSFGKQFIKERNGELTEPELELLLYELNRIWRERQKRIINTYSALKAHQVGKYKRKLQNLSASKSGRTKSVKQINPANNQQ